jgi:hypothetical protein
MGSYMVRYPLGGMLAGVLQWLIGFLRVGHDVSVVEKSGWADSCFDPTKQVMSDDCSYGVGVAERLLTRFNLQDRWCYVDTIGRYYGMSRARTHNLLESADLFLDYGSHGAWLADATRAGYWILVDGEPGYTQIKMAKCLAAGQNLPQYDAYYPLPPTSRMVGP